MNTLYLVIAAALGLCGVTLLAFHYGARKARTAISESLADVSGSATFAVFGAMPWGHLFGPRRVFLTLSERGAVLRRFSLLTGMSRDDFIDYASVTGVTVAKGPNWPLVAAALASLYFSMALALVFALLALAGESYKLVIHHGGSRLSLRANGAYTGAGELLGFTDDLRRAANMAGAKAGPELFAVRARGLSGYTGFLGWEAPAAALVALICGLLMHLTGVAAASPAAVVLDALWLTALGLLAAGRDKPFQGAAAGILAVLGFMAGYAGPGAGMEFLIEAPTAGDPLMTAVNLMLAFATVGFGLAHGALSQILARSGFRERCAQSALAGAAVLVWLPLVFSGPAGEVVYNLAATVVAGVAVSSVILAARQAHLLVKFEQGKG